jgi:hypothetical protein
VLRIDTPIEAAYLLVGGIMPSVLEQLLTQAQETREDELRRDDMVFTRVIQNQNTDAPLSEGRWVHFWRRRRLLTPCAMTRHAADSKGT